MLNVWFIVFALVCCAQGIAQPSGEEILKNIEANFAGVHDYTVTLDVALDIERLKVPQMKATMYFKQPDKVHFQSEGFALLPKEGLGFTPGNLTARFVVDSVKEEKPYFILVLRPKSDKTRLRKVYLKANSTNWTVEQITTPQFDGRQMKAAFEYQKVKSRWLPSQLTVTFMTDTMHSEVQEFMGQMAGPQRPSQIPRTGTIRVRYADYHVNTGLKDDIFEPNEVEVKR